MQKTIPLLYFYTVSLIGFVLLIIGIFSSIHYFVNVSSYREYPLGYNPDTRCAPMQAVPQPVQGKMDNTQSQQIYQDCIKNVQSDRHNVKIQDAEKALSFTIIGLLVFGIHFAYVRLKQT